MKVQVRGTTKVGEERESAPVSVQLQGVELAGRRRWLITELTFPGQSPVLTGGMPPYLTVAGGVGGVIVIAIVAAIVIRRRRSRAD